jgi:type 1 glutamine amidotransferase
MTKPLACIVLPALLAALSFPFQALATGAPKKILVVTVTTGYRHASIPTGERIVSALAASSGKFTVEFVRQPPGMPATPPPPYPGPGPFNAAYEKARAAWLPSVAAALQPLSPARLAGFDAVMFLNTTGDLPLPDRHGFIEWIRQGHAFIGVHAATDTFHGYPEYIAMLGGEFNHHGAQVSVNCLNLDPAHPACVSLPPIWTVFDEIYQFKNFDRGSVQVLLALDRHPNEKTPGFYPVAWCRTFGTGRVFYTSLGHRDDVWDETVANHRMNPPEVSLAYQRHLLGGILWTLGLAEEGAGHNP